MSIYNKNKTNHVARVLCVNLEGSLGGAEHSLLLLAEFIPSHIQLSVACPKGLLADRLNRLSIKTYRISDSPGKYNHPWIWFFYLITVNLQLLLITIRTKSHIIHANSFKAVLAVALMKATTGKRIIWQMRDLRCSKLWVKICGHLSSKVIAISHTVQDKLISQGLQAERIRIIHNGVNTNESSILIRERKDNCMTFANIGQFVPWKNQLLFIDIAERLLQEHPNAHFILIGDDLFKRDGSYKKKLVDRVKSSHFSSHLSIIGWQNELSSWWSKIDCLVHTAETEPFGRVIIEAMAYNVPVIAAKAGGPAEIITDGKTGLLFDPGNTRDLAEAMKKIAENEKLRQTLAQNAREHVRLNFHPQQTAEKISHIYTELTAA